MKRDWDVIREVLIEVEGLSHDVRHRAGYALTKGDTSKAEQALLLWRAGFIAAVDASTWDGPAILAPELTWQGHDLLETIRSQAVWERIKTVARDKGLELTFDAVKALGGAALSWVIAQ